MAFMDVVSFVVAVTLFVGGIVGAIFLLQKIRNALSSTKASLRERGWTVSESGVSIKTKKRMDQSNYLDTTQRGIMKAMNASTFGNSGVSSTSPGASPNLSVKDPIKPPSRQSSGTSTHSANGSTGDGGEKKRRKFFSRKASS